MLCRIPSKFWFIKKLEKSCPINLQKTWRKPLQHRQKKGHPADLLTHKTHTHHCGEDAVEVTYKVIVITSSRASVYNFTQDPSKQTSQDRESCRPMLNSRPNVSRTRHLQFCRWASREKVAILALTSSNTPSDEYRHPNHPSLVIVVAVTPAQNFDFISSWWETTTASKG